MSVAAVANKEDKKPLYKDYVSFLGSYKQGKKDEAGDKEDRSSPSGNSSASITSDLNDMPKKGFKEYLENYNNKKFNPVKNPNQDADGKMVKTEVFIEINKDINSTRLISKTFDLNTEPHKEYHKQKSGVDTTSSTSYKKVIPNSKAYINAPVSQFKTINGVGRGNIDVEEIPQRKIENNVEINKHPLKKTSSITEKSKIFEKISTKNKANCRVEAVIGVSVPARNGCLPSKPVLQKGTSPEIQKDAIIKPKLPKNGVDLPATTALACNIQQENSQSEKVLPEKSTTGSPSSAPIISCSIPPQENISCGIPPPRPPPLPANILSPKKVGIPPKPNFKKSQPNYSTMPKLQNTRQVDAMDGCPPPALDKQDPRVKKMVYGALREMYGAYHDKANDYLATLPKNRVKKNNGLDSIINSIASQGGLEKLTGRGNPKVEAE